MQPLDLEVPGQWGALIDRQLARLELAASEPAQGSRAAGQVWDLFLLRNPRQLLEWV